MIFGVFIFGILFLFLASVLLISIFSIFKKDNYKKFEPDVSVVIPCYNEEENIKETLDAVFESKYPLKKLEVIVVDDGSTDGTLKILQSYERNIKIIQGKHGGKSDALNLGCKAAKNEIILSIDADTLIGKGSISKLVLPFQIEKVAATNGSCLVQNKNSILGLFQNVEYNYNNLIKRSFSSVFNNGIWFFGAFACYRKSVLHKLNYFKKDTVTEDADISLEIYKYGYKTMNVYDAYGYVLVPTNFKDLFKQRTRWWMGVLQALKKNKLFSFKSSPSIQFLYYNQYWWSFYAIVSIPLIIYQYSYWFPKGSFYEIFMYTFRWFTVTGPFYVIYKISEWGISLYNIFGVTAGLISVLLILVSIFMFNDRKNPLNLIGVFFYFPYTIVLNIIILISLIKMKFLKRQYFMD